MIATNGNIIGAALFIFFGGVLVSAAVCMAVCGNWTVAVVCAAVGIVDTCLGTWAIFSMRPKRPFYGHINLEDLK